MFPNFMWKKNFAPRNGGGVGGAATSPPHPAPSFSTALNMYENNK